MPVDDIDVKNAAGTTVNVRALPATMAVSAASLPLPSGAATSAKQDTANTALAAIEAAVEGTVAVSGAAINAQAYETVAASQTDQALGATGATGDYLAHILIVPATTSPGAVSIKDGGGSAITIFAGGADSVGSLVPFAVPINAVSAAGAWSVTTGASVSVIGVGTFT